MARSKLLAVAVAAGGLLACNAIIGLSDFEKQECAGKDPCPYDGGTDADSGDTIKPDGGPDANPDAPPGVGPVSWAAFQMPNEIGDAGLIAPLPLDYDISVPDIATDNVTHLVWRRKVVGTTALGDELLFDEARTACANIKPNKWRLPKRIELVTLLSHSRGSPPYIHPDVFPAFPEKAVWTSSEVRDSSGIKPNLYWAIDFATGALTQIDGKKTGARVLCVEDKS